MKAYLYILFFLFSVIYTEAQDAKLFRQYRDSFIKYEYFDTTKAGFFLKKTHSIALKDPSEKLLCEYYLLSGWFIQDRSDYYKALAQFKKSAEIARKHKYVQREADAYGNIANVYDDLGITEKSMEYQQRSLVLVEKILLMSKDSVEIKQAYTTKSAALGNLSYIYKKLKEYDKAIAMMHKSMKIDSMMRNYEFLATGFSGLGNIYRNMNDYENALRSARKSIIIRQKLQKDQNQVNYEGIYQTYHTLGNIHLDLGNLDSAMYFFKLSDEYGIKAGDRSHRTFIYQSFGNIAEAKGKYQEAIDYYLKAYNLSLELDAKDKSFYLTEKLSSVYSQIKDYKNAYNYLKLSTRFKDSTKNLDKMRELGKAEVNYEFKLKSSLDSINFSRQLDEQEKIRKQEEIRHDLENAKNRAVIIGVISILIVVLIFSVYLIKLYRDKKKANDIIAGQKKMTEEHLTIIAEKQKEIVDSINYAKRIQYALLAHQEVMQKYLPEHFIFFKPKDIVSGDFYWFTHVQGNNMKYSYLAVCDSTGHGVPGAFMSLLNISFMNEAINEKGISDPGEVFNHVRLRLIQNLGTEGQKDGFDGILLRYDHLTGKTDYAAANNSPILINADGTQVLPCDKMPVGKGEMSESFSSFEIPGGNAGMLYLPTDGYPDQFGGEKGKKLKFANMLKHFFEINKKPMTEQAEILNTKFELWRGKLEQLDDVCIIGLKLGE